MSNNKLYLGCKLEALISRLEKTDKLFDYEVKPVRGASVYIIEFSFTNGNDIKLVSKRWGKTEEFKLIVLEWDKEEAEMIEREVLSEGTVLEACSCILGYSK